MNSNQNQNHSSRRQQMSAFTLIEMIGVLAVIAILAALLIPKVFNAISEARVNGVCVSTDTVKTAVIDHYGKFGTLATIGGTNALTLPASGIYTGYDTNVLMVEGLLDKPYAAAISTNATIELCAGGKDNAGASYTLAGGGGANGTTATAQYVVEAVLYGVSAQDAKDLNDRIDGTALGSPLGSADTQGRVEYQIVGGTTGTATVYIYLTCR
jgi:type II secretory pathway pseudopilin PulG